MNTNECLYCGKISHLNFLGICSKCYNLQETDIDEMKDAYDRSIDNRIAKEINEGIRRLLLF